MIYVISLLGDAGDGTISSSIAVADTEARARAIAKALMLQGLSVDLYDNDDDLDPRIAELAQLTGLKDGMTNEEYLQIAWTLNMTIEDLWEIFFDYSLKFDDNPELEIRSFAENGMDYGGFYFGLGGQ